MYSNNKYNATKLGKKTNQKIFKKGLKRPASSKPKTGLSKRGGIKR